MKKTFFLTFVMMFIGLSVSAQDIALTKEQLPKGIQTFISKNFSDKVFRSAKLDKELLNQKYEVKFEDGTEVDFDKNSRMIQAECKTGLPSSIVSKEIQDYVTKNYGINYIVEWELKTGNRQEIKLDNKIEMIFNDKGQFLRLD
ncbi:PepSY-like domain-containing protein [Flavobacterium sp. NKUCC04_CG]|uniref:PepSY-like domain-containing protein n=1 Tax=Flavobacterium sp. NKUCC04_CG TaxID=2842121 RepID=UPI001C5AB834|nr:PepSY-like domain-containing protein [Flavobacterium sp. NKUCC04_CG]MBW3519276.1 PepSY-like domain-containing protein [Flavobacterium sp. NKUCC04_CG]